MPPSARSQRISTASAAIVSVFIVLFVVSAIAMIPASLVPSHALSSSFYRACAFACAVPATRHRKNAQGRRAPHETGPCCINTV